MDINPHHIERFAASIVTETTRAVSWSDEILSVGLVQVVFEVILKDKSALVSGTSVAAAIFREVNKQIVTRNSCEHDPNRMIIVATEREGWLHRGESVLKVIGDPKTVLVAESIAMPVLAKMSGIASSTAEWVQSLAAYNTQLIIHRNQVLDHNRFLEKYALIFGGARSHRFSQSDSVLLKKSHILLGGGIAESVSRLKESLAPTIKIEVECFSLNDVHAAVDAGADLLLVRSLTPAELAMAVRTVRGRALIEVSGDIPQGILFEILSFGVDFIGCEGIVRHANSPQFEVICRPFNH